MKKQYAVFGLGSFGRSVALTLESLGSDVIVVDKSYEKVQEISDSVSYACEPMWRTRMLFCHWADGIWTERWLRYRRVWRPVLWPRIACKEMGIALCTCQGEG